jgi:aspartate kinase
LGREVHGAVIESPMGRPSAKRRSPPVLVQKFGGTSVSSAERRQQVIGHVRRAREEGYQVAIVVSAMGRQGDPYATDTLLDLLRSDGGPVDKRDYDMVFICGEIISATLMAHLLKREGIPGVGLTGAQAGIYTDGNHSEAEIVDIDPTRVRRHLERGEVPVVAGCQGLFRHADDYTTLGRGGSDTSGVALGVALNADKVEIFTDVEGVFQADPRVVPEARMLERISYGAMHEMARYGAGVVHPRAVRAGQDGQVPVVVRSTFGSTEPTTGSAATGTVIADVEDEFPLVGIATLGPLEAMVLGEDILGSEVRAEWERRRLIMSLVDEDSGALILAVSSEKAQELAAVKEEVGPTAEQAEEAQSWVSLIGDPDIIQEWGSAGLDLLERQGIEVLYRETAGRRSIFVVAADDKERAVGVLHRCVLAVQSLG